MRFESSLHIVESSPFSDYSLQIFSLGLWSENIFLVLTPVFLEQKSFILMKHN